MTLLWHSMASLWHHYDIIVTLRQTSQSCSHLTAPSAPLMFQLFTVDGNPTLLNASWGPPDQPNGMITAYTVYCNTSADQFYPEQVPTGNTLFTVQVQNGDTSTLVSELTAFTRYECSVTANTSAGEGESSNTQTARTDESGVYVCVWVGVGGGVGIAFPSLVKKDLTYLVTIVPVLFNWVMSF